jgi:hypothetical protein
LEREYEGRSSTVEVLDRADPGMGEGIEEWNIPNRNELLRLIRNLVSGSPLLHRLNSLGRTPLLSMIFRYFYPHQPISIRGYSPVLRTAISENDLSSQCGAVVRVWLEQLKESKIDLVKYGEAEHHLHYAMAEEIGKEGSIDWQKIRGSQLQPMSSTFRLLSFTYGSVPSEWKFWVIEIMNDAFAEFWDMIDHSERKVPGAWTECVKRCLARR